MFTKRQNAVKQTINAIRKADLDKGYDKTQRLSRLTGEAQRETIGSMTTGQRLAYLRNLDNESKQ